MRRTKTSFVVPLLLSGVAMAQSLGTFSATGSMATARLGHTATLLTNGKVLIAGGSFGTTATTPGSVILASAELYDPSTRTFTPTGNMVMARASHAATLLPDGKVLIAGGRSVFNGSVIRGGLDSVEIYDPSTGTFTGAGKMTTARILPTATLLTTGKVLIAGNGIDLSAELYDPSTGTFVGTGSMTQTGAVLTATLLNNGKVLVGGVVNEAPTAELYNPATVTFGLAGIGTYRYMVPVTSTQLPDGKVLNTSVNSENVGADAELYDPSIGVFSSTGSLTTVRTYRTATLLPSGAVLVTGQNWHRGSAEYSAELYDAAPGTFTLTGDMTIGRVGHTATLLPAGTVLFAGGAQLIVTPTSLDFVPTASAELYHPPVLVPSPVLFSLSGDGRGQGAIQHAGTNRIASAEDPAVAGEYLSIYLTGLTDLSLIPPQVAIGGRMAEVSWFGNHPGYAGLNQINVRVPDGISPGLALPVRIHYIGRLSNEVTIGLR